MSDSISRRAALTKLALLAGGASALGAGTAHADAQMPHLTPSDPTAVALGYHQEASQVDAKQFSNYKPGEICGNCLQSKGEAGQTWRPCNLFPGKLVNANGWCRVWVKRS